VLNGAQKSHQEFFDRPACAALSRLRCGQQGRWPTGTYPDVPRGQGHLKFSKASPESANSYFIGRKIRLKLTHMGNTAMLRNSLFRLKSAYVVVLRVPLWRYISNLKFKIFSGPHQGLLDPDQECPATRSPASNNTRPLAATKNTYNLESGFSQEFRE
jgi:hypothetical protein